MHRLEPEARAGIRRKLMMGAEKSEKSRRHRQKLVDFSEISK